MGSAGALRLAVWMLALLRAARVTRKIALRNHSDFVMALQIRRYLLILAVATDLKQQGWQIVGHIV